MVSGLRCSERRRYFHAITAFQIMRLLKIVLLSAALLSALSGQAQSAAFKLNGHELELPSPILFEKNASALLPTSAPALRHIKDYLMEKTYITTLRIEGHADGQVLSEQRALAVYQWLVQEGLDCKRLVAVGFGDTKPIANATYADGAGNARIAVVNAAMRGRAIGGMPVNGGGAIVDEPCE